VRARQLGLRDAADDIQARAEEPAPVERETDFRGGERRAVIEPAPLRDAEVAQNDVVHQVPGDAAEGDGSAQARFKLPDHRPAEIACQPTAPPGPGSAGAAPPLRTTSIAPPAGKFSGTTSSMSRETGASRKGRTVTRVRRVSPGAAGPAGISASVIVAVSRVLVIRTSISI